ncbi:MAG: phage integrase N-terminal SAM-like domain-containing protein [Candidatus Bathyarchaeia archaeon]
MSARDVLGFILKRFVAWLSERSASVSEASVNEFLEQYKSERNLKASTLSLYKGILQRFVEFLRRKWALFNHS